MVAREPTRLRTGVAERLLTTREVAAFLGISAKPLFWSLDPEIEVDAMAINDGFTLAGLGLHDDPSVENLCADLRDNRNELDLRGLIGEPETDRVPRLRHEGRSTSFWTASP
jgi:hypothetical protein